VGGRAKHGHDTSTAGGKLAQILSSQRERILTAPLQAGLRHGFHPMVGRSTVSSRGRSAKVSDY
jgi:hypothetical protein